SVQVTGSQNARDEEVDAATLIYAAREMDVSGLVDRQLVDVRAPRNGAHRAAPAERAIEAAIRVQACEHRHAGGVIPHVVAGKPGQEYPAVGLQRDTRGVHEVAPPRLGRADVDGGLSLVAERGVGPAVRGQDRKSVV